MKDNIKYSHHKEIKETGYLKYDNYDAIEVPYVDAIPSDYEGVMGVPVTFLDKYCPEQFEIIGATESEGKGFSNGLWNKESAVNQPIRGGCESINDCLSKLRIQGFEKYDRPYLNGKRLYYRLLIRKSIVL